MLAFVARVGSALVLRPRLVPTAIRQVARLAPERWWATGSHLPIPRADYVAFRSVTLSGDPNRLPEVDDVLVYLEWCRSMRSLPSQV